MQLVFMLIFILAYICCNRLKYTNIELMKQKSKNKSNNVLTYNIYHVIHTFVSGTFHRFRQRISKFIPSDYIKYVNCVGYQVVDCVYFVLLG